jgi:predicted  nucleic acid-binding Zn-ribbon protein
MSTKKNPHFHEAAKSALAAAKYFQGVFAVAEVLKEIGDVENYEAEARRLMFDARDELDKVRQELNLRRDELAEASAFLSDAQKDRTKAQDDAAAFRAKGKQEAADMVAKAESEAEKILKAAEANAKYAMAEYDKEFESFKSRNKKAQLEAEEAEGKLYKIQQEVEAFKKRLG